MSENVACLLQFSDLCTLFWALISMVFPAILTRSPFLSMIGTQADKTHKNWCRHQDRCQLQILDSFCLPTAFQMSLGCLAQAYSIGTELVDRLLDKQGS
jgi:hypothetical protein